MKPWKSWLACLGVAGACLAWVGCGKSDTPDPDSDSNAAKDSAPADAGAESGVAQAGAAAEKGEPAAKDEQAPAEETKDATAGADKKATSATGDMLALSGNNAAGDAPAESGAAAPAGGQSIAGPGAGGPGGGGGQAGMAPPSSGMPKGYPGGGPNPQAAMRGPGMAGAAGGGAGNQQAMRGPGMAGAGAGGVNPQAAMLGGAGAGGGGGADEPADFRTQTGAVTAFLNAVKAKDPQRLHEATALRAEKDNEGKRYEKLFRSILDESISQDELDELAKRLDGFQIVSANVPKSTAKLGIILQRTDARGDAYQRTITVRREKEGWKVCEIGNEGRIQATMGTPTRRPGRR